MKVSSSLVLAAAERIAPETGFSRPTALADEMAEAEFLRGCLAPSGTQLLAGVVLHPAAFAWLSTANDGDCQEKPIHLTIGSLSSTLTLLQTSYFVNKAWHAAWVCVIGR
jgi:hypothetical protein